MAFPYDGVRFQPGNPGKLRGAAPVVRRRARKLAATAIMAEAAGGVRTLHEIAQDPRSWKGPIRGLFESVARDATQVLELRLHCAAMLLKDQPGLDRFDRAEAVASGNGYLLPLPFLVGLAVPDQHSVAVRRLHQISHSQRDELGTAERTSEAERDQCPVPLTTQRVRAELQHRQTAR